MTEAPPRLTTLADKINFLFIHVYPADRGRPWTNEEVARSISEQGQATISDSYLGLLRKGLRDNPTKKHLEALAKFFNVQPAFFFEDDTTERVAAQIEILAALSRSPGVRQVALRAADLSQEALTALTMMIENVRQMEAASSGRRPPSDEA